MILRGFFLVLTACIACSATAQQYRWTDKDGRIQYTDAPPPPWAKDVRRSNVVSPSSTAKPAASTAPKPEAQVPFEVLRLQKDFPVSLYTSPNCKEGCDLARAALNQRGVPFKEVQVYDPDSNEELKRVSGAVEVPTLLVGRTAHRGFEQGAFDALLDSAGYPRAGLLPRRAQKAPPAPEGFGAVGEAAKPAASTPGTPTEKAGPYDTSGLKGPPPKPGQYDPSGLTGPAPKPGQYGVPGEASK
jgi:glutaredoxin